MMMRLVGPTKRTMRRLRKRANRALPMTASPAEVEPRLKVCVLAACPFPANHGTPGSIRELAEATAERGHEVHVVTYHIGEDLPVNGVQVHRIPDWTGERGVKVGPTPFRPLYDFQMIFTAIQVIKRYQIDLIHAHSYESALVAACCRPVVRCPVLYSAHNQMGDELASYDFFKSKKLAKSLAWLLDRTVPRLGDRCIPHSVNLQQFLLARGLAGRSEPVLNFGIDVDRQPIGNREWLRSELGFGNDPIVLYSGVIDPLQRLDLLLGAMVHVVRRIPQAKLILLATIPNERQERLIRDLAVQLGIKDHVILLRPSDIDNGRRLLSICDIAAVPRPGVAGFPIKLLNYMLAAKPSVMFASSASGVVHGEHVWLAGEDTRESLGQAIVQLLKNPALRARIATGGQRFVRERHDRRVVAAQLCQAYVRLLDGSRRWNDVATRPRAISQDGSGIGHHWRSENNGYLEVGINASA